MPFNIADSNIDNYFSNSKITVTPSKVIELLSIYHVFIDDEHKVGKETYFSYLNEFLTDEDKKTIYDVHKLPFHGLQVMLLALETNEFNDVDTFINKVNSMPDNKFIYIMSGELTSQEDPADLKKSPEQLKKFIQNNQWISKIKDCSFEKLINNTEDFKSRVINLFNNLNNHKFIEQIQDFKDNYIHAQRHVDAFLVNNQPMDIVGDFRGFNRTQSFRDIVLVPAVMLTPHRTYYFHNNNTLLILYDPALIKDYANLQIEKSVEFLKTISDLSKFNILLILRYSRLCSTDISEILNLSTATISRHMDSLMKLGLIEETKEKNTKYYKLNPNNTLRHFEDIRKLLF